MSNPIIIEADHTVGVRLIAPSLTDALAEAVAGLKLKKVLLIPPDYTRPHSYAGEITSFYYKFFKENGVQADILVALGTHAAISDEARLAFFGDIPKERFLTHNFREAVKKIGEIPKDFIYTATEGTFNSAVSVEVSNHILDPSYDLIISIGQVVPHEVAGMANYTKNIVIGCGGEEFINFSHMAGAFYGIERTLGETDTPVRRLFDYAEEHFLSKLPLLYVLTVVKDTYVKGLYIGKGRSLFEKAAALSREYNIIHLGRPINKCVVYLDENEFHSTWLGNKAVYRSRMAVADGGSLIIIAPGVKSFGEDEESDSLIRKYGFVGREKVLELSKSDLSDNLAIAAHLIHGSADGRFNITYAAPKLGRQAVEAVGYNYMEIEEALALYDPAKLKQGYNANEEIYYIANPALGLWKCNGRM